MSAYGSFWFADQSELSKAVIEVSSGSDTENDSHWWLKDLRLTALEHEILISGKEVNDSIVNATQKLLKSQFSHIYGLQNTLLGNQLKFETVSISCDSVQVFHTGMFMLPTLIV